MMIKLLNDAEGLRTVAAILEPGEEVMTALRRMAEEWKLTGASLTVIGAFERATLQYFDWDTKDYVDIPVDDQVEVASLNGDIAIDDSNAPVLHVHVVLGRRDGSAVAGHLKEGIVRPTLEVVVTETPSHLARRPDAESGLSLIRV